MRGIVYDGTNTELVDGLEVRAPGPRDVIVEIAAAGVVLGTERRTARYPNTAPHIAATRVLDRRLAGHHEPGRRTRQSGSPELPAADLVGVHINGVRVDVTACSLPDR